MSPNSLAAVEATFSHSHDVFALSVIKASPTPPAV